MTGYGDITPMSTVDRDREWQEEQLLKFIKRSPKINSGESRINGKNLFIYCTDTSNDTVEEHNTEYLAVKMPIELERLIKDNLVTVERIQFTIYNEDSEEGNREYKCFYHCIINWDNFGAEQDIEYWRSNLSYLQS